MTIADCISTAMRWMDQATSNGVPCAVAFTADFEERMRYLLDSAVSLVETIFPIHKSYKVTHNMIPPTAGFFAPRTYNSEPFEAAGGRSFSFEVAGTVRINIDGTITESDTEEFTRFFGEGNSIKITSDYPFMVRNFALWGCSFKTVPEYRAWVPVTMPPDFGGLDRILFTGNGTSWSDFSNYRFEDDKTFSIPYNTVGEFDFQYLHRHTPISPSAPKTTEIDIDPKALVCVPLRLAIEVTSGTEEMQAVNQFLNTAFIEQTSALDQPDIGDYTRIQTIFHP